MLCSIGDVYNNFQSIYLLTRERLGPLHANISLITHIMHSYIM